VLFPPGVTHPVCEADHSLLSSAELLKYLLRPKVMYIIGTSQYICYMLGTQTNISTWENNKQISSQERHLWWLCPWVLTTQHNSSVIYDHYFPLRAYLRVSEFGTAVSEMSDGTNIIRRFKNQYDFEANVHHVFSRLRQLQPTIRNKAVHFHYSDISTVGC